MRSESESRNPAHDYTASLEAGSGRLAVTSTGYPPYPPYLVLIFVFHKFLADNFAAHDDKASPRS